MTTLRTTSRNKWRSGFTLIELALVCVVLGILLVATVPRFQQTAQRLRVEHTAFEFMQLLRYAREQAIARNQIVVWHWDQTAHRVQLEDAESNLLQDRLARSTSLPPESTVTITQADHPAACACVRFLPDGTYETQTTEPTVVQLAYHAFQYELELNAQTGQVVLRTGTAPR